MTASDTHALTASWDALTPEVMRARGSLKWVRYPEAIGAWVAEMDLGTAPAVTEVLQRAVRDGSLGYTPDHLARAARQEVARYQQQAFGWEVAEPDVSLAPDVLSVLMTLITRHTRPGSPVIVPTPAYMPFLSIPGVVGRDCLQVRALRGRDACGHPTWELDLEGIEAAMAGGGGLLVLCNPWNPVGRVLSLSELDAVAALSARYGVPVFADEIHAMLVIDPGAAHTPYACRPGADPALTFTAISVSKAFNVPGLRCAQLIATGPGRAAWDADGPSRWLSHEATLLGVQAAVAALRRGLGWLETVRAYLWGTAGQVAHDLEQVPGLELTVPSGSYLAWLDCSGLEGAALEAAGSPARYLLGAGVAMNDGAAFGAGYERFCRLNLAMGRGVAAQATARIAQAVADLG